MFDDEMDLYLVLFCLLVLAVWCVAYPQWVQASDSVYSWLPR